MNKRSRYIVISLIIGFALLATAIFASKSALAQTGDDQPGPTAAQDSQHSRATQPPNQTSNPTSVTQPSSAAVWTLGPASPFELTRFDGAFVPGPEGEAWANKVYFPGGRSGSSTEDSTIWSFDPVAGTYVDTGYDVIEDVSNYFANVIPDDGTSRGPAIYIIGGYDVDNAGSNIGTVQRFYPQTGVVETLPAADDWTPTVAGSLVGAMGQAVVGNTVYVFGGWENVTAPYFYAGTWAFDPTQPSGSRWTDLSLNLNPARCYIQVAVQGTKIYAMGGVYDYTGGDLAPTTVVEVLDTSNLPAGWATLTPMPVASGEGRGFGFDADTLKAPQPWNNHLYVVGGGDWSASTAEAMEYLVNENTWDQAFPDLITTRRDHAGVFVPTCTADPDDGLPGLWVFGGHVGSDSPPFGPTEFYPMGCEQTILLVDDDWDFSGTVPGSVGGRYYYTQTLDALGYDYDVWDTVTLGDPTASDMSSYTAVIWFTGYAWEEGVFTPTNETEVAAYLDGGGRFILSSQDYYYETGTVTPFMQDYLGIDSFPAEDVVELDPVGNAGNPIGDGLGPYSMVRPDIWYTYWPTDTYEGPYDDYVYVAAGAAEPFNYNASAEPNSTNLDAGVFRTVYLAWPFEWIGSLADRQEILDAALHWLTSPTELVVLIPDELEVDGLPGTTVNDDFILRNNTLDSDSFDLEVTSDVTWTYAISDTVGPVDPSGGEMPFPFSVDIPGDALCSTTGVFTVTATSFINPAISGSKTISVRVACAIGGTVLDANTGDPIAYAYVWAYSDPNYYETYTDAGGQYLLYDVLPATYSMGATAQYFEPSAEATVIVSGSPITHDFQLNASLMGWSPDRWDLTFGTGRLESDTLTINNTGTGPLYYSISLLDADEAEPPLGAMAIPELPRIDPQIAEDINANGLADFVVVLNGQADLTAAYSIKDWNARGEYVYNTLSEYADRSQTSLRHSLTASSVNYTPLYIINAVIVRGGDMSLVNSLAARADVAQIIANRKIAVEELSWVDKLLASAPTVPAAVEWNISLVNADDVWGLGYTGQGMVVAEVDSGTQWDHPALKSHYRGWNGFTADHNYNWYDPLGDFPDVPGAGSAHGTHVMGTMVGDDGGANQIGMAPGAEWISCKAGIPGTNLLDGNALLECAQWMIAPTDLQGNNPNPSLRPNVVNNSWGGGPNDYWYAGAVGAWRAAGIFPSFATGNAGPNCSSAHSPGDYWNSFGTGATDYTNPDTIAGFSGRGPALYTGVLKPQIVAPGVNIRSSVPGGGYEQVGWSGTSMATPHTSGAVALLWSAAPDLIGQIDLTGWVLEQTADPLYTTEGCGGDGPTDRPNNTFGWGRLDILAAVQAALDVVTPDWVTVDPMNGTVLPGETVDITLSFTVPITSGVYTATLWLVADDPYNHDVRLPIEVTASDEPPVAEFASNSPVYLGEDAVFTSTVTGIGPFTYAWAFGDGGTSALPNPNHVYTATGVYNVSLGVTSDYGEDSVAHDFEVVGIPPTGTFTSPAPITLGELVTFTVMVNGTGPFEYEWDFGDGVTSTLESPTHMYEWADTFTVTVTVTSDWGSFTLSDQFVVNAPVENYEYIYLPLVGKGP